MAKTRQILDEDHFGLEKPKDRILEYLAVRKLKKDRGADAAELNREPILCFVGPPGVGKTSLAQSIAKARRFVANSLETHHPPGVVLDCSLIASEMATNAYRHADGSPFRVGVRLVPGRVRITVEDTSITPPSMPHPLEHDEGGRGVAIIDALSDRWGADSLPSGKVVWAEVLTASSSRPASEAQRA